MRYVDELSDADIRGKRVLIRAGLNVPVEDGKVVNDFRLRRALETLRYLKDRGARVIVIGHIGRDPNETLAPVAQAMRAFVELTFVNDVVGVDAAHAVASCKEGEVIMLENVRQHAGETKNDEQFAKDLAAFADVFVFDAFAVMHRPHASVIGVPKHVQSYAGLLIREEIEHLARALNPTSPSLAIIGGAKFETKEPLIKKLLAVYDHVFVGGALANDIFKTKGYEVGRSLVADTPPDANVLLHGRLIAPVDVVVEKQDDSSATKVATEVVADEKIVDIGPVSVEKLAPAIKEAQFVLWNGPMGLYEGGYDEWTRVLAKEIAASDAQSIVGGGDTLAAIQKENLEKSFGFISTGGGAMLQYLLEGTLPGIEALQ